MAKERLQKILARAGVASRRKAEALIVDGRVRVNGRVVEELGAKADGRRDKIEVDGKRVVGEPLVYYLLNKPREVVSTMSDPQGRPTVQGLLKRVPERVFPVGRLDYHTSGAMLVTNDGELSDALLRPKSGVPKVYAVKMTGHFDVPELDALRNGVTLEDGTVTRKAEVFVLREEKNHTWLQLTLREGMNRQIRRMAEALGRRVMRLSRQSFAGLTVEGLRPGQLRPLKKRELERLKKRYGSGPRDRSEGAPQDG